MSKTNKTAKIVVNNNVSIVDEYLAMVGDISDIALAKPHMVGQTVLKGGIAVTVNEKSVIVNPEAGGSLLSINGNLRAKGALSALSTLQLGGYARAEIGFQSHYGSIAEAAAKGAYVENYAALSSNYAGNDPILMALKPKDDGRTLAVARIDLKAGRLVVGKVIGPVLPEWKGEKTLFAYQFHAKHEAIDLILSGAKINIAPFVMVKGDDGKSHYSEVASKALIAKYAESLLEQDLVVAKAKRDENIANARERKAGYKSYKAASKVAASSPELVEKVSGESVVVDGESMTLVSLIGKKVTITTETGARLNRFTVDQGSFASLLVAGGMNRKVTLK